MNSLGTVNIREFYSICAQAIMHSGKIIRDLFNSGALNSRTKYGDEPFTDADVKVQTLLIKSLSNVWPSLKIIGEEEESFRELDIDYTKFRKDFISEDSLKGLSPSSFKAEDAIVWIDPLDGTVDFLKGELDCVTTLIGVSLKSEAKIGVVGRYFRKQLIDNKPEYIFDPKCYYGCADHKKAFLLDYNKSLEPQLFIPKPKLPEKKLTVVTSKNHLTREMEQWIKTVCQTDDICSVGGAGNKMLLVIEGLAHCYAHPSNGTKKWDTCAGEALLKAVGGRTIDTKGKSLEYIAEKSKWRNEDGLLAYITHDKKYDNLSEYLKKK